MIKDYIEMGRVILAIGAFSLIGVGITYLDQPLSTKDMVLCLSSAFFLTLGTYSFNNLTDRNEDLMNKPGSALVAGRKSSIEVLGFSFLCKALAIISAYFVSWALFIMVCIAVLVSFLYSHRFFGTRLKDLFVIKSLTVAGLWAVGPMVPILAQGLTLPSGFLIVMIFVFFQSLISTVLADLKDVRGDIRYGIKTIPSKLGMDNTIDVLIQLNIVSLIIILLGIVIWDVKSYLTLVPLVCIWRHYGFWLIKSKQRGVHYVYNNIDNPVDLLIGFLAMIGFLAAL